MIRPSMLNRAERCGLVPVLSAQFPEAGEAADRGTAIHAEIAAALRNGPAPTTPEAIAAFRWHNENIPDDIDDRFTEEPVSLVDPDSMDIITEGTPDVVWISTNGVSVIVDWKTGQPENQPEPDDSLQLISYGLAAVMGNYFRVCLVFLDGDKADARWSRVFEPSEHPALLARVKAAANREPQASPGDHCLHCYQRHYCHAWKARVSEALTVVDNQATELTTETASQLHVRIKAVEGALELAKSALKAYVLGGGDVVVDGKRLQYTTRMGKESADVKALQAAGLTQYIKRGEPFLYPVWKK